MNRFALLTAIVCSHFAHAQSPAHKPLRHTREALWHVTVGRMQQHEHFLTEATLAAEEAVKEDPRAVLPRMLLVHLYEAADRTLEARKMANAVLEIDPAQLAVARSLARLNVQQGRTREAIQVLEKISDRPELAESSLDSVAIGRELGQLYDATKQFKKAMETYRKAIAQVRQDDPLTRGELAEAIARSASADNDAAESRRMLETAQEAFRDGGASDRARLLIPPLTDAIVALGQKDEARAMLSDYLATKPQDIAAYETLVRLAGQSEGPRGITAALKRAVDRNPEFLKLRVLFGDELRKAGNGAMAEEQYRYVVAKSPDVAAYRGLFQVINAVQGFHLLDEMNRRAEKKPEPPGPVKPKEKEKPDEVAVAHVNAMLAALTLEPVLSRKILAASVSTLRLDADRSLETWRLMARLAIRSGQLSEAQSQFQTALTMTGNVSRLGVYEALIRVLQARHKYDEVIAVCQRGLRERPTDSEFFYFYLGLAYAKVGRAKEALEAADQGVDVARDANRLLMRQRRIGVHLFLEQHDAAVAEAESLLKMFPEKAEQLRARMTLANVYSSARKYEEAEAEWRRVIALDPESATAHNSLGFLLAERARKLPEAEALIRQALKLARSTKPDDDEEDDSAAYQDSLAWALFRRGRWSEARAWLEKSLSHPEAENDPVVWDHLGDVAFRLGDRETARRAWDRAMVHYRDDPRSLGDHRPNEVKRKLERVQSP